MEDNRKYNNLDYNIQRLKYKSGGANAGVAALTPPRHDYKRYPGERSRVFVMCAILTLLYASSSSLLLFMLWVKYTHDWSEASNVAGMMFLVVMLLFWPAFWTMTRKQTPLPGWQTAPIRHYAFESKTNEGRTIQRTTLELSAEDMYELRRIAELVVENGETFNARTIGPGYSKWRRWLMKRGWLAWKNRDSVTGGVVVTDKGYNEFRNILNPPSPNAEMSRNTDFMPITHATEVQNDHQ